MSRAKPFVNSQRCDASCSEDGANRSWARRHVSSATLKPATVDSLCPAEETDKPGKDEADDLSDKEEARALRVLAVRLTEPVPVAEDSVDQDWQAKCQQQTSTPRDRSERAYGNSTAKHRKERRWH